MDEFESRSEHSAAERAREFLGELSVEQLREVDEFLEQETGLAATLRGTRTGEFLENVEKLRREQLWSLSSATEERALEPA